jgi:hypothetical protein
MATLATQVIKRAGVTPAYAAAAGGGDKFTPDAHTFLHVKNAGGAPITVTLAAAQTVENDLALASLVVTVPNASEKMIGPLPYAQFVATDGTGLAPIAYSAVTSVTVAVIQLSS